MIIKPKNNQARKGSLDKAIRLIILMRLQDRGVLKGSLTLVEVSRLLPKKYRPSVMTISRDLRAIKVIRNVLSEAEGNGNENKK